MTEANPIGTDGIRAVKFRQVPAGDADAALRIIRDAQAMMKELGRKQWQDGYPAGPDIERDIARGYAYGLYAAEGSLIAYGAVVFDGEPTYRVIRGEWLCEGDYVVLHRLAVAKDMRRRGLARQFFAKVEEMAVARGCASFRVDTNYDNTCMLALLPELGFTFCGEITLASGDSRKAFEKPLRALENPMRALENPLRDLENPNHQNNNHNEIV
ncbi:MAG: GNAT family N-acetyltransferase [Candidatus Cryptobacteroides sp.]